MGTRHSFRNGLESSESLNYNGPTDSKSGVSRPLSGKEIVKLANNFKLAKYLFV